MFKSIVVLGLGGVGRLVAVMLRDLGASVRSLDIQENPDAPDGIDQRTGDVSDPETMKSALAGQDAVISCLPYQQTLAAAQAAHALGLHYFDPTEDVQSTKEIRKLSSTAKHVMIPQNGLAPGFIGILGSELASQFDNQGLRHIRLRVGALPQNPIGQLGYAGNWSLHGLVHEYIADCEAIIHGQAGTIPALRRREIIRIFGSVYEAFTTSGGLGTMTETFAGRVETLNYKSIRYPGHLDSMRLLLEELRFRNQFRSLNPITIDAFTATEPKEPELLTNQMENGHDIESGYAPNVEAEPETPKTAYEKTIDALSSNQVNCTKRAVTRFLKITGEEVDDIFKQLLDEGIVSKKPNNHYQWHGVAES